MNEELRRWPPIQVQLIAALLEQYYSDTCPGCKRRVSALKHDFSLCTRLANAEYRLRALEAGHAVI